MATVGLATAAGASAPKASFTGSPIKIGLTYVCNAAQPPSVCEMAPSAQAAVKYFNAKGGAKTADGKTHQLSVVVCNNENDRTKTADCGRQFVDAEVTFATGGAVNADEIVPVLGAAGIAYFNPTPLGTGTVEGGADNSYLLGSTLSLFQGLVQQLAKAGNKDIAIVAQGAGAAIAGLTKKIAADNGAQTSLVEVAQTNPNWAQAAEQASSADVIMTVADKYGTKAFLDAATQAGKTTPVTSVIGIVGDAPGPGHRRQGQPALRTDLHRVLPAGARQGLGRLPGGDEEVLTQDAPGAVEPEHVHVGPTGERGHQEPSPATRPRRTSSPRRTR